MSRINFADAIGRTVDAISLTTHAVVVGFSDGTFIAAVVETDDEMAHLTEDEYYADRKNNVLDLLKPNEALAGNFITARVHAELVAKQRQEELAAMERKAASLRQRAAELEAAIAKSQQALAA